MRTVAGLLLAAAALAAAACDLSTDVTISHLRYEIEARHCSSGCTIFGDFATTVTAGDTISVIVTLEDTLPGDTAFVRVRPDCAVGAQLWSASMVVANFPDTPTCPDSSYTRYVGQFPRIEGRAYTWVVDAALDPGPYSLFATMLVSPPMGASVPVTVN